MCLRRFPRLCIKTAPRLFFAFGATLGFGGKYARGSCHMVPHKFTLVYMSKACMLGPPPLPPQGHPRPPP